MFGKRLATGLAAVLAAFAWTGPAGADDTVRLGGRGDARTMTLELRGGADTLPAGWHRGSGGWRRGRGWAGWRRGWGWRHGGRWGWAGYRWPSFYTGWYFPRFYGFELQIGRPYYVGSPVYYPAPYNSAWPVEDDYDSGSVSGRSPPRGRPKTYMLQPPRERVPPPASQPPRERVPAPAETPDDGGRREPLPMPRGEPGPTPKPPAKGKVAQGRVAPVPAAGTSRFAYPADGEPARRTAFAQDRPVLIVKHAKSQGPRP